MVLSHPRLRHVEMIASRIACVAASRVDANVVGQEDRGRGSRVGTPTGKNRAGWSRDDAPRARRRSPPSSPSTVYPWFRTDRGVRWMAARQLARACRGIRAGEGGKARNPVGRTFISDERDDE